jgi:F-type H+-transporting ATPase subunit delta
VAQGPGSVYGRALFEAARETGKVDAVQRDLGALGEAVLGNANLVRVLFNPGFPESGKKQVLLSLAKDAEPLVVNFLQVLADHGRLSDMPAALEQFEELHGEVERSLEVVLITAIPLDDAQAERLRATLASQTGRPVALERRVDPTILGGVVLRVRDLLIDASVRGRLEALRVSLRKARLAAGPAATGGSA